VSIDLKDHNKTQALQQVQRLESVLFQFVQLYERWSEDRQVVAKLANSIKELGDVLIQQMQRFGELEPQVRRKIEESISIASNQVGRIVSEEANKSALNQVKHTVDQLEATVERARKAILTYEREVVSMHWKVIIGAVITTVLTCVFLVWLVIPKPAVPMTNDQVRVLTNGKLFDVIWPKLTEKEQERWHQILKKAQSTHGDEEEGR
jgi:exonuclease VII large subunit